MEGRYVNAEYVLIESSVVCRTLGNGFVFADLLHPIFD